MQLIYTYYNVVKGVMQLVKVVAPIIYLKKAIDHRTYKIVSCHKPYGLLKFFQ